ncbi:hypothetical protein NE237_005046 [Protea cynaroides]|uniref:Nudix hydrolase domain-containing protein n=1 Tax=Protea cynaroides TaxID=273540 RepID=A0A9Q0KJW0_9MAGN|nr:hypothetical protein NE237_005046 [Protea cynaroides]
MENADPHLPPSPLPYKLLLKCPSGLFPEQVSVDFSASYDRTPHPDTEVENTISETWDRRIGENPSLYNGEKFRYGGHVLYKHGDSNQVSHVCLQLGLTDYRNFIGTNLNNLWEKFLLPAEDDSIRCQHTSSPLGNGAVVETSDKKIIVLQRSNNVGEFPGHIVFPGGHPEPHEIGILAHQHENDSTDSRHINKKVSQEMFDSIIREVVEEIGVPATSLSNPVFIGISRRELNVRPAAFFFINCNLESREIQQLYCNAQDSYESTHLYFVSRNELENMTSKMPGCHSGGFALYTLMLEASNGI